jgi:signal transduction histidine kinase
VDKLKYEFITVAAHKLRTPLTEIKWGIEAIKDETNEKGLALLNEINNSASRLLVLSDELLSVSKAEASQYQYKFELVNIKELTEGVVRDFRNKIKEKNIELVLNIKENLPKIKLDKMRMSSVIQILLENAVNYTKNKINITIIEDEKDLLFSIEDNGIGIKKEDIPYIFSQFYRTHEAYLTETEGSGIGLFLAKKIIEKHSGKISVQSEGKGKGSEFWFKLKIE